MREIPRIHIVPYRDKSRTISYELLLLVPARIDVPFAIQSASSFYAFVYVRRKRTPPETVLREKKNTQAKHKFWIKREKKKKQRHTLCARAYEKRERKRTPTRAYHGISRHVLHCSLHSKLGMNWHLSRHFAWTTTRKKEVEKVRKKFIIFCDAKKVSLSITHVCALVIIICGVRCN